MDQVLQYQQKRFENHIETSVSEVVKGSDTPMEASRRIRELYSGTQLTHLHVEERGQQFFVLIKLYPDATHHSFICDR